MSPRRGGLLRYRPDPPSGESTVPVLHQVRRTGERLQAHHPTCKGSVPRAASKVRAWACRLNLAAPRLDHIDNRAQEPIGCSRERRQRHSSHSAARAATRNVVHRQPRGGTRLRTTRLSARSVPAVVPARSRRMGPHGLRLRLPIRPGNVSREATQTTAGRPFARRCI
jgi:hypothetical protein